MPSLPLNGQVCALAGTVTVTTEKEAIVYAPGVPVPYTPGATISFGGIAFAVSGSPHDGDSFSIGKASGEGDSRNALALGQLQDAPILDGKTTSFHGSYSGLASAVAGHATDIRLTSAAAVNVLSSATARQQAVAGMNLDEEAANLLRYQQAYQAAGKAVQAAHTMYQGLLRMEIS